MNKSKKNKNKKKKKTFVFSSLLQDKENNFSLIEVIIIIFISVIFGCIIGYLLTYRNSNLSRVRSDTYLGEVVSTYNNIVDNYYDDVDENSLAEAAIKGMISSLGDPYSIFLDESSTDTFNESVDGEYIGIGITVEYRDGYNVVLEVLSDGPSDKAGIQVGDIILSIDGNDCHNIYPGDLNKYIVGDVGSSLIMKVKREDSEQDISIVRQIISIQNVISKTFKENNKKIGYIQLKVFSSNSYDQFEDALTQLEKDNIQSLILDLRDNPGGHLAQAKKILSMFFDKKVVLYQIERNGVKKKVYSTSNQKRSYPIVILINAETASSAEVVASCFQDNYKKIHLVGVNSYGKGNVQKSLNLSGGTSIKFTIERWLTPKGRSVSEVGVTPDIFLKQESTYYIDYLEKNDTQLQKALSILK